ncbi:DUF2303 family protein [Nocardia sp. NPDC059246]|uniref:DUF2303 family protein n=1 Tax=unclassified Nocardia TaxID=2637762 RepID=UPI0036A20694
MSTNNIDRTETDAAAEIALDSMRFNQDWHPNGSKVHVNILRDGERVAAISHEKHAFEPYRARGESTVSDVASFATLLGMAEHHGSVIFANEGAARLTAVVNFHGWRDHRVALQLTPSEQLRRWTQTSGKLLKQGEFIEFIEDNYADITDPTAADMLELAQSFQATRELEFDARIQRTSGAVRFRYHEDVQAKAGASGEIEVPETFVLGLPIWRGGQKIELSAALRYRIGREGLQLGFKVLALDEVVRDAFASAVTVVAEQLDADHGHTIVYGPAPDQVTALA